MENGKSTDETVSERAVNGAFRMAKAKGRSDLIVETLTRFKQSPVSHLLLAITFFLSGLAINILQAILYLTIRQINKQWYRIVNEYLCYSINCQLVFVAEWWSNSETILYIDKNDFKYFNKEHACLIMNHKYEVDWLLGFLFCERIGGLGNCKAYIKKSIQYVPSIGWLWKFAEFVFLDRNWDKDKTVIGKQITELASHPTPILLLLCAEGTRFTEEKHQTSLKFARENNLPILKHHLSPRTKGFTTSLPFMSEKVGALYDVTICVKDSHPVPPTMTSLLNAQYVEAHMFLQRIPLEEVPKDEEGAAKWLHDLYVKKDKMVDSFKETGDFFATSGVRRVEASTLPRRWYSFANTVGWAMLTIPFVCIVLYSSLVSGSTLIFSLGVIMVIAIIYLHYMVIGLTKIRKASSYGSSKGIKVFKCQQD